MRPLENMQDAAVPAKELRVWSNSGAGTSRIAVVPARELRVEEKFGRPAPGLALDPFGGGGSFPLFFPLFPPGGCSPRPRYGEVRRGDHVAVGRMLSHAVTPSRRGSAD